MDEHAFEKMNRTLDALVEEHLPQEVIIAWTEEALVEMGFPRLSAPPGRHTGRGRFSCASAHAPVPR